ncbi:hypothetical protein GCM10023178_67980 [Actinomadura luteofluorescens]
MPNIGTPELLIILLVVVLIFGSAKLPQLARSLGKSARILKAETKGLREDDDDAPADRPAKTMPSSQLCVEGLRATPFEGGPWNAKVLPVFVVGENDELTRGIGRLAEELGEAELVTVPGAHHEVPGGPHWRVAVLDALSR